MLHKEFNFIYVNEILDKNQLYINTNKEKILVNSTTFSSPNCYYTYNVNIDFKTVCMEILHYFNTYIKDDEEHPNIYTIVLHRNTDEDFKIDMWYNDKVPLRCRSRYVNMNNVIVPQCLFASNASINTVWIDKYRNRTKYIF